MRTAQAVLLSVAMSLGCAITALAADPASPHPHQGIIAKYDGTPPVPELTEDDLVTLAKGEPVKKQVREGDGGGRGIAVQDIHADPTTVWSRITKYEKYPDWVDNVYECETYEQSGEDIKVRFKIGAAVMKIEYFVAHIYKPDEGYMTWTLDYDRESDLDDSVGFWRVQALPDKPGWTRVYYSVDVRMKGWVPGWVEDMIAKSGLTKATSWVKRESEKAAGTAE